MSMEHQGTFNEALKVYQKMTPIKSTIEIGRMLGIPDDYNKRDVPLLDEE